jgi:tripartite ATP-independent transporter DctM subunit
LEEAKMNEVTIGCLSLAALLILFLTGIELAFAMAIIGFLAFAYIKSGGAAVSLLSKDYFDVFTSYAFTVLPLFMLMGQIAFHAGLAEKMFATAKKWLGHVPGGLALATIVGATLFKAICGSTLATAATFSSVVIPEMDRYGYSRKLSTGTVASVGTIGMLIPPSGNLIIFAMITEQSVGKLFMAGIVPGVLIAFLFLLVILAWVKINPSIAPKSIAASWSERVRALPQIIWPVVIFLAVVGGMLTGLFTPTEAGAVGVIAILALTLSTRMLGFKGLVKAISESLRMSCMIFLLVAGSQVLGHLLQISTIPMLIASWASSLGIPPFLIIVLIIFIYLLGGSFIDDAAFMILATPIFYPVVLKLGFDPIWFAIIIGVTLMIGVIIPPVAAAVFIVKSITKENIWVVYGGCYPFIIAIAFGLVLLFVFPGLATWLPNAVMK